MKKNIVVMFLMSAFIAPTIAEKPDWAGKGKPTVEQKSAQESVQEDFDDEAERIRERNEKKDKKDKKEKKEKTEKPGEPKGLEKQKDKKNGQIQNEIDKGSEKGKESREENSRKWWKFWGD